MKLVSIIIINWNGKEHLEECLQSLDKQTYKDFEIIIVDNGSTDSSKELIKKKKLKLIENSKNLGFAKPNNQGIKIAKGEFILTLNNDIRADENFLKELMNAVKKYPDFEMFSCKMLFYNGKVNSKGLKLYSDAKAVDIGFNSINIKEEEKEVFGPCGGAALYSKKLIEDISFNKEFFDEDFFLYSEDLDVALRARLMNHKCLYVPKAIVYHKHNTTAKKIPNIALYHYTKNKLFLVIKNYPLSLLLKYLPIICLRQFFSTLYYLFKFNLNPLKARIMFWFYLPRMIKKRFRIQKNKKISNKELKKWLLPRPIFKSIFTN